MTMNVLVGCEVPPCCDWQAGEEEKEMPLFPQLSKSSEKNKGLRQHGDKKKRITKKTKTKKDY